MPGDFLTSQVNTFPCHIQCRLPQPQRQNSTVCDHCLRDPTSQYLRQVHGFALAVIYRKRGKTLDEKALAKAKDWIDRFGNTRLHISAALGARYSTLKSLIDRGADIHALNSGRQSFMHVLDPHHWSPEDMVYLREQLRFAEFDFHQKDLQGLNFIDYL